MTIITNDSFEGIDRVFGVNMVSIRDYVNELHDVVVYKTGTGSPVFVNGMWVDDSVSFGKPHPNFDEEESGLMAAEGRCKK